MKHTVAEALAQYDEERAKLLGNEGNSDLLWRAIIAADNLATVVTWWEP